MRSYIALVCPLSMSLAEFRESITRWYLYARVVTCRNVLVKCYIWRIFTVYIRLGHAIGELLMLLMISGTYQFWAITEPIECGFHAFDMGTIYIKPKYTFFIVFNYSKLCYFNC